MSAVSSKKTDMARLTWSSSGIASMSRLENGVLSGIDGTFATKGRAAGFGFGSTTVSGRSGAEGVGAGTGREAKG